MYIPGRMSLECTYTYQDLCPWNLCIYTRTSVLGIYVDIPGLLSLEFMYTYQDLCPWNLCMYIPGRMSLECMYTYQDLCPWNLCILTRTSVLAIYVYIYIYQDLCPGLTSSGNLFIYIYIDIYLYIDIYVYNIYIYTLIHELILRFLYMAARTHVHTKDH